MGSRTEVTADGPVGRLRLLRPEKHNAIDQIMADEAIAGLKRLVSEDVRVVVLEADGPTFCAGNDLAEVAGHLDPAETAGVRLLEALVGVPVFTIAAIHGPALGAGVAMCAVSPHVVASERAWFSLPERDLGLYPAGVLPYLEVVMGPRQAFALGLSGRRMGVAEAVDAGLVDEVVPSDELAERSLKVATWLASTPGLTDSARQAWQQQFHTSPFVSRRSRLLSLLRSTASAPAEPDRHVPDGGGDL